MKLLESHRFGNFCWQNLVDFAVFLSIKHFDDRMRKSSLGVPMSVMIRVSAVLRATLGMQPCSKQYQINVTVTHSEVTQ